MHHVTTHKIAPLPRVNRSNNLTRSTLAIAISSALFSGMATSQEKNENVELDKLKVEETVTPNTNPYAVPGAPYLVEKTSDVRRSRPLAETPATISVITADQITESGRSDLRAILDGQPGITLGTGENGNAFGDRYVIRGHEARSDVFVDGLRDPGMTVRETFAVEQVEITKGPSSTFAGRGSTGGAVNTVSKRASTEYDFNKVSAGIGTDNMHRLSLDVNKVLGYDTALRANLLHAEEDVPDRAPADRSRQGAALSLTHHFSDKLEVAGDYYHFDGKDKPDLGSYLDSDNKPVDDIAVYAQDQDFLESTVDTGTLRIGYEFTPKTRIVNLTRFGTTDNGYVATGARGTTAYPTETDANNQTNGFSTVSLSTHQGWQEVEYFGDQLSLLTEQQMAGFNHELVFGLGYTDQKVLNGVYDINNNGSSNCWTRGRGGSSNEGYCFTNSSGASPSELTSLMGRDINKDRWDSEWHVKTLSLSAMDTVDLTDQWTVFAGIRYDFYDYTNTTQNSSLEKTTYEDEDGFWNGHVGVTYEIKPGLNLYGNYSTSTNINGGESDLGSNCGYGGVCTVDGETDLSKLGDPEQTENFEIGAKWSLNGGKLLATASAFRIIKSDVMEANEDSYSSLGHLNTGGNEVEGVEFSLAGNLTEKLMMSAGIALMNAKVTDSYDAENVGKTLSNFADNSASLHMKYQVTPKLALGGTATYESERFVGQPDSAGNEERPVPAYTVFDAFASYSVDRDTTVRLNVGNVFDKDYYLAGYRSGGFLYMGDARSAQLTLEHNF